MKGLYLKKSYCLPNMCYLVGQVVQLNAFIISFPFILEDASEAVGPNISNLPFLCKENN